VGSQCVQPSVQRLDPGGKTFDLGSYRFPDSPSVGTSWWRSPPQTGAESNFGPGRRRSAEFRCTQLGAGVRSAELGADVSLRPPSGLPARLGR
jgi:hypothetical protein